MPIKPPIDEQLTMAPLPCSRIWRSSYFMQCQTPRRLIPVHTLELFAADISHFHGRRLYAGVIERRIETPEGGYSLRDHRCYFSLVGDIATDANRLVPGGDEFFCCGAN